MGVTMTELAFEGPQPPIEAYASGGFRLHGAFHEGPILVGPNGFGPWAAASAALEPEAAAALIALAPAVDVLLVGLGAAPRALPRPFRAALEGAGLFVEAVATPAACRTYNVLLAEDRRVAAALLPV